MPIYRFEKREKNFNTKTHPLCSKARRYLQLNINAIFETQTYTLDSKKIEFEQNKLSFISEEIFSDSIFEMISFSKENNIDLDLNIPKFLVQINYLPGVTDNEGNTATEALKLVLNITDEIKVYSGKNYYIYGEISIEDCKKLCVELLCNELIQKFTIDSGIEIINRNRFLKFNFYEMKLDSKNNLVKEINLNTSDEELLTISNSRLLALELPEMLHIKNHYQNPKIMKDRKQKGLGIWPTDVEIEIIAQSWSEHCKHKIFSAHIDYSEQLLSNSKDSNSLKALGNFTVHGLFPQLIKGATDRIIKEKNINWTISLFNDNGGIVRFDENIDYAIKVETHNSPSALDPYGGALTGILGVNRDILGTGLGAKPIANTNVLCFGPPNFLENENKQLIPKGLKHPRYIFEGVHKGIEDGGNQSGIPTVNGSIYFDSSFIGKPLVHCGTLGVLPQKIKNIETDKKNTRSGDLIVVAGGRVGKDGIHGATFSSLALDEFVPNTVVQIGDPITQKRLSDFILEARDLLLYTGITDNGAGGLSSSIGEMASFSGGAKIDLKNIPTKYPGLFPYELIISESQERMTFSVSKARIDQFLDLAKNRNVEAVILGEFNESGYFEIYHDGKIVAYLSLEFLHNSLPKMKLKAEFLGSKNDLILEGENSPLAITEITHKNINQLLDQFIATILSSPNVASKENWVRIFDHEVQGATVLKPYSMEGSPENAGVIWAYPHGGNFSRGVSLSTGIWSKLSSYDTYLSAQYSLDEAVRNAICSGADPNYIALVDNFCWPDPLEKNSNPDSQHKLAQLVRACKGLYDLSILYGMPFVSGKDSMKNDFIGKNAKNELIKISVKPTVLITALGSLPDISKIIGSQFKDNNQLIYVIGKKYKSQEIGLQFTEFSRNFQIFNSIKNKIPPNVDGFANLELYKIVFQFISMGILNSIHDISDGGLIITVIESLLGTRLGAELFFQINQMDELICELFHEGSGRFIVSVQNENRELFESKLKDKIDYELIGKTTNKPTLIIKNNNQLLNSYHVSDLKKYYQSFGNTYCGTN